MKLLNLFSILVLVSVLVSVLLFVLYLNSKENLIVDKNADSNNTTSECLYNNYSDSNANDLCEWVHSKCFVRLGTNYIY